MDQNNQTPAQIPQEQKSNNRTVWIVVVLLIIVGLGWYFMKGSKNQLKSNSENTGTMKTETNTNSPMSLKDLMAGKSQKCEVSYENNKVESKGVVFVSNGKMKGDFTTTVNGQVETTHMINDGATQYMWMEGKENIAFKMPLEALKNAETAGNSETHRAPQGVNLEEKHNYNCSGWSGSDTDFTPPSNVKFTDYGEIMNSMMPKSSAGTGASAGASAQTGGTDVKAMQCAACDSLSGEQKTQCKAALACK